MVNVNSQIPFNLHNRVITPNPSVSRSVSLSTGHHDHPTAVPPSTESLNVQLRSPPSPLTSQRNASQSKSRSLSLARNHPDGEPSNPILNVRLVNTVQSNLPQRVGRPRHRAYGSDSSTEHPKVAETRSPDAKDPASASASVSAPDAPVVSTSFHVSHPNLTTFYFIFIGTYCSTITG